jgi:hypothetical protein
MFYLLKQKQSGFVWILPVSGAETSYNQTITLAPPFFSSLFFLEIKLS